MSYDMSVSPLKIIFIALDMEFKLFFFFFFLKTEIKPSSAEFVSLVWPGLSHMHSVY